MKFMKQLLAIALLAIVFNSPAARAETATYNPTSAGISSVVSSKSLALTSVIFANSATSAVTVAFFDAPTNVLTYVIGAYTNSTVSVGTTVVTFTNILGSVQSQTNATITTTLSPQAQTTNNYQKKLLYVIPASSTVNLPLDPRLVFSQGLAITNSATNIILTLQYQPAR
jgi:hypothetical protein